MFPYIVADIGGTNARFALVTGKVNAQYTFENIQILNGQDYASFEEALSAYIATLNGQKPLAACAAIAGPVGADRAQMTNLSWSFSCSEVAEKFGFSHFIAMNDFAAVAAAANHITDDHLINIKPGTSTANSNKAVFGPGTGLGVAGVVNQDGQWSPLPSEGGHVNIAPATPFETEIIRAAMDTHGHVSAETFLSGPGLVNLYRAICTVKGAVSSDFKPADITTNALTNGDDNCSDTLNTFCSFLGAFAGNLALTYGAKGGVYMAGGILPRFSNFLIKSDFTKRFTQKGPMSHYVENIPADLIVHPEVAFAGAAAWLERKTR